MLKLYLGVTSAKSKFGNDGVDVQEDIVPPPPMDETASEKMERISATIKLSRNEISEIM